MRKCTSFPSLVVLKYIHMVPFLLLPLLSLSLSLPSPFKKKKLSNSCFRNVKNSFGAQTDDTSDVFVLLSCCWLCRLTVGWICSVSRPSAPEQSFLWNCAQTEEATAYPQTGTHTQIWGGLISCVGQFFFLFFKFLFLSVCFSLVSSLFLSFSPSPCLRKVICFKTRAKYYHIYIFLFQEGSKRG